jgi:hypothetical protein
MTVLAPYVRVGIKEPMFSIVIVGDGAQPVVVSCGDERSMTLAV